MINAEVIVVIDDEEVEVTAYDNTRDDWENVTDVVQNDTVVPDEILLRAIRTENWGAINAVIERTEDSALQENSLRDYIADYYTGEIDGLSDWIDNLVVTPKDEYLDYHRDELINDPERLLQYVDVDAYLRDLEMSGSVTVLDDQVVDDAN